MSATGGAALLVWAALRRYADVYRVQARLLGIAALVVAIVLVWLGTAVGADRDEASWRRVRHRLTIVAIAVGVALAGVGGTVLVINVVETVEHPAPPGEAPAPEAPAGPPATADRASTEKRVLTYGHGAHWRASR